MYWKEMIHYQNIIGRYTFLKAMSFKILPSFQFATSTYIIKKAITMTTFNN